MTNEDLKNSVKEKYGSLAIQNNPSGGCCGTSCCGSENELYSIMLDEYKEIKGYVPEADLGLGCGLPTELAGIKKGNTVLDLGSGAGNDVFIARNETGDSGFVIGVDMTPEMIVLAEKNKQKMNYSNVDFRLGEIESLPVDNDTIDVVISNCVLNLVPDKQKAFSEIYRVLKKGAHFCVSDIVLHGELPAGLRESAVLYAGCISGALSENDYLSIIKETGFENIEVKKSKVISLPEEMLRKYLSDQTILEYHENKVGIFSITVTANKK